MAFGTNKNPVIENSLPGWDACNNALNKYILPTSFGFPCEPGELNRLSARYRLAKSFEGINLKEYNKTTADGYSSILRVFLTYSAFEQLLACCGIKNNSLLQSLPNYGSQEIDKKLRSIKNYELFFETIFEHLDRENHRKQIRAFLNNNSDYNLLYLPAGIRHIFAHGKLTPNSKNIEPNSAIFISNVLVEFLFSVMDGEFQKRLKDSKLIP